jgi:uncharacterized protein (DUF2336 family)
MLHDRSLLPDLEQAVAHGSPERRVETLEQITRLFLHQAHALSAEQIALFGDVFERLIAAIETRSLAALSRSLAPVEAAPANLVLRLAESEDIAVAGPVLEKSSRLGQDNLRAIASTHSQAHLLAISGRPGIQSEVTDVLVRRGDRAVTLGLAANATAQLSEPGYAMLVNRAGGDGLLAEYLSRRADLPVPLFHRLVAEAAAVVQQRLLAIATPERKAQVRQVLAKVSEDVGGARRRDYTSAQARIAAWTAAGRFDEATVAAVAENGSHEETLVALAALCEVPIEVVDRLASAGKADPILVLCKAAGCTPQTVAAVLRLQCGMAGQAASTALEQFEQLSPATAQRIAHFWRSRTAA